MDRTNTVRGLATAMVSTSVASIPSSFHVVSRMADASRYRRVVELAPTTEISNQPPCLGSIRRPKIGSESNRGQHIQSIEPADEVRAAVRVSPSRPYSRIGGGLQEPMATA